MPRRNTTPVEVEERYWVVSRDHLAEIGHGHGESESEVRQTIASNIRNFEGTDEYNGELVLIRGIEMEFAEPTASQVFIDGTKVVLASGS